MSEKKFPWTQINRIKGKKKQKQKTLQENQQTQRNKLENKKIFLVHTKYFVQGNMEAF